ncbi:DUF4351 domain-containing protein [Trichothermofontia sp.]
MRESVIYPEIFQEGELKGRQAGELKGRQEGRREEAIALTLRWLTRQFGELAPHLTAPVSALAVEQLEALVDVVFDFADRAELEHWLAQVN